MVASGLSFGCSIPRWRWVPTTTDDVIDTGTPRRPHGPGEIHAVLSTTRGAPRVPGPRRGFFSPRPSRSNVTSPSSVSCPCSPLPFSATCTSPAAEGARDSVCASRSRTCATPSRALAAPLLAAPKPLTHVSIANSAHGSTYRDFASRADPDSLERFFRHLGDVAAVSVPDETRERQRPDARDDADPTAHRRARIRRAQTARVAPRSRRGGSERSPRRSAVSPEPRQPGKQTGRSRRRSASPAVQLEHHLLAVFPRVRRDSVSVAERVRGEGLDVAHAPPAERARLGRVLDALHAQTSPALPVVREFARGSPRAALAASAWCLGSRTHRSIPRWRWVPTTTDPLRRGSDRVNARASAAEKLSNTTSSPFFHGFGGTLYP